MMGTADGAAGGCPQPLGIATACGRGWDPPRGCPGARSCLHAPAWMSPSGQHGDRQDMGMGTVGALPGLWPAASPVAPAGGTEPGGGLPSVTPLPTGSVPRARLYYGLAVGTGEPSRAAASLHDASVPPNTPNPSETLNPSPPPSTSAAPPQPPPRAASPQGTGEEQPPTGTGTVPMTPTPLPAHIPTTPGLPPTAPSHALLYSRPLCPAVSYRRCQNPAGTGGLWAMLLPIASTPVVLPHFQRGSLALLPGGEQRKVEELREEDFLRCAAAGSELCISSCVVRGIQRSSHAGFASLRVCLGEQDGQVRGCPLGRGSPCPQTHRAIPCAHHPKEPPGLCKYISPKALCLQGLAVRAARCKEAGKAPSCSAWREWGHRERQARLPGATYMSPASSLGGLSKHQPQRAESAQAEQDQPALAP